MECFFYFLYLCGTISRADENGLYAGQLVGGARSSLDSEEYRSCGTASPEHESRNLRAAREGLPPILSPSRRAHGGRLIRRRDRLVVSQLPAARKRIQRIGRSTLSPHERAKPTAASSRAGGPAAGDGCACRSPPPDADAVTHLPAPSSGLSAGSAAARRGPLGCFPRCCFSRAGVPPPRRWPGTRHGCGPGMLQ